MDKLLWKIGTKFLLPLIIFADLVNKEHGIYIEMTYRIKACRLYSVKHPEFE
jgi:hypothetical protein